MKRWVYLMALALMVSGCGAPAAVDEGDRVGTIVAETLAAAPTGTLPPSATTAPPEETVVPPTAEPAPNQARTYADPELGFAFDYPEGWAVAYQEGQSRGSFFQFAREGFQVDPDAGGLPPEEILMQVSLLNWEPSRDLEAYLDVRRTAWDSSGSTVISEETWIWHDGIPGVSFVLEGVDGVQSLIAVTTIGDLYLTFSGPARFEEVDAAARSLRVP